MPEPNRLLAAACLALAAAGGHAAADAPALGEYEAFEGFVDMWLSLIHISEPTRL